MKYSNSFEREVDVYHQVSFWKGYVLFVDQLLFFGFESFVGPTFSITACCRLFFDWVSRVFNICSTQLHGKQVWPFLVYLLSKGHTIYLLMYVGGIIITSSSSSLLQTIITSLNVAFSLKHLNDLN